MDDLVKEIIPLLQYLIPGFLTAWIFYSFTSFRRPDTFGQLIQALIFTFIIHSAVAGIGAVLTVIGSYGVILGSWDVKAEAIWSGLVAILIGIGSCHFANNDKLHTWLRDRKITKQSSYPSEWFYAFTKYQRFVVLHMDDDRRIYGWPVVWPSYPGSGEFVLEQPSWLNDDGTEMPLAAEIFVISAHKVQWVEFTEKNW